MVSCMLVIFELIKQLSECVDAYYNNTFLSADQKDIFTYVGPDQALEPE